MLYAYHFWFQATGDILGKGSFGEVRICEWNTTKVATKTLTNFAIAENESLFEQEIAVMQELHHPCVVQFLGFCKHNSTLALVMEYLPNGDQIQQHILFRKCCRS
jgi:serine/threonine protein kinase